MKKLFISACLALLPALVLAQTADAAKPAPAKTSAAIKTHEKSRASSDVHTAKAKAKTSTQSKKSKKSDKATSSRTQLRSAAGQVASGVRAAEAALTPEELAISKRVYVGKISCELGNHVTVTADEKIPGYFNIEGKSFNYRMAPVATTTGAVRLEDPTGGAVWIQIANKSMLMDQKHGQRLADDCMSPAQVAVADSLKKAPARSLFDGSAK